MGLAILPIITIFIPNSLHFLNPYVYPNFLSHFGAALIYLKCFSKSKMGIQGGRHLKVGHHFDLK